MQQRRLILLLLAAAASMPAPADEPGADNPPDSPDALRPEGLIDAEDAAEDVIAARQALMTAMENLMQPIDTYTVDDSVDPDRLRANAAAISGMLPAVPYLFPSSTNRYDPADQYPVTLALPAVWERFPAFQALALAASTAAADLAATADGDELRAASLRLRVGCDACHAGYLLPYEPAGVTQEDLDFDFDSIFEND